MAGSVGMSTILSLTCYIWWVWLAVRASTRAENVWSCATHRKRSIWRSCFMIHFQLSLISIITSTIISILRLLPRRLAACKTQSTISHGHFCTDGCRRIQITTTCKEHQMFISVSISVKWSRLCLVIWKQASAVSWRMMAMCRLSTWEWSLLTIMFSTKQSNWLLHLLLPRRKCAAFLKFSPMHLSLAIYPSAKAKRRHLGF